MSHKKRNNQANANATEEEEIEQTTRPVIYTWENSYRMQPTQKFKPHQAQTVMQEVFDEFLEKDLTYELELVPILTQKLSENIKKRIESRLDIPSYKLVVETFVGQIKGQSIAVGSRWLWNSETDNYASLEWKNV